MLSVIARKVACYFDQDCECQDTFLFMILSDLMMLAEYSWNMPDKVNREPLLKCLVTCVLD